MTDHGYNQRVDADGMLNLVQEIAPFPLSRTLEVRLFNGAYLMLSADYPGSVESRVDGYILKHGMPSEITQWPK